MSRGKKFEQVVREAFEKNPNISIDRLPDPTGGYLGVRNICDFIIYKYPFQLYLECKVQQGNTLNWSRISDNQWNGLLEKSKIPGVVAGVLVWFVDHDITTFVPIQELEMLRDGHGQKSLHITHLNFRDNIPLEGRKKRIFFEYDAEGFLKSVSSWANRYWQNILKGEGSKDG